MADKINKRQACCSACGQTFDVYTLQSCPKCGNPECMAYKPWMHGCSYKGACVHRPDCEWGG